MLSERQQTYSNEEIKNTALTCRRAPWHRWWPYPCCSLPLSQAGRGSCRQQWGTGASHWGPPAPGTEIQDSNKEPEQVTEALLKMPHTLTSLQLCSYTDDNIKPVSHRTHCLYGWPTCKLYIQRNKLWPDPSFTRAIWVHPWKLCIIFKLKKNWHGCHVCVWMYKRSYKTLRDRI